MYATSGFIAPFKDTKLLSTAMPTPEPYPASAFSPRARRSRPYRQHYANHRRIPNPIMMEGLEGTGAAISLPGNQDHAEKIVIRDMKYIGSYNWINAPLDEPTIIVPGSAARWNGRPLPYDVQPDTGPWPVDEHTSRLPTTPFLPLMEAVNQIQQEQNNAPFDWPSVDFITSRNVLRNLTRWTRGQSRGDFRIDLDLAGEKTVLLNRWSFPNSEGEFCGNTFGINFERESTTIGEDLEAENATGNIRVVSYDLNGLKMVVRFEVNAYLPGGTSAAEHTFGAVDALTNRLESVEIHEKSSSIETQGPLKIIRGGHFLEEDSIEITTRSVNNLAMNGFDWCEAYPQLFLSQTKHHYLAIHERGHFMKLEKRTLESDEFKMVEEEVQDDLKKLYQILLAIQEAVRERGKMTRLSLVFLKDVTAGKILRLYYTREPSVKIF